MSRSFCLGALPGFGCVVAADLEIALIESTLVAAARLASGLFSRTTTPTAPFLRVAVHELGSAVLLLLAGAWRLRGERFIA